MSLQHIQKNSPRLLPKPAKFEKNPPNGYRVFRKTKCGAARSPIHKQASLAGRLSKGRLINCVSLGLVLFEMFMRKGMPQREDMSPDIKGGHAGELMCSPQETCPRINTEILMVIVTTARPNQGHITSHCYTPSPMSLPSINFFHLMDFTFSLDKILKVKVTT